ncbi:MAG TPA: hypothetical protein VLV88_04740 [Terriglobales bacterium]|nr:hypothetical protein [Terriglobales bacterium]
MTAQDYQAPASVGRLQTRALIVGLIGLMVSLVGWFTAPAKFYQSYLIAFMMVLGLSLGSLGLVMLQHLTGGHWGIIIRRPLEAASRALWLVLIFFLPILLGMKYLYFSWLTAPKSGEGALSPFAQHYLTTEGLLGFYGRAAIYFVVWFILMLLFNSWSRHQDADANDETVRRRMKMLAGPGIILYVFGITFAAIDWVMSLSPHWASTIYGFLFVAGQIISSMALMIAVVVMLSRSEQFAHIIQARHLHDLGKLLFAFIMLWAYFDFSQLLIIWSGNLPEEISYYRSRLYGSWGAVAIIVLVFHFFVPFFLLLSRDIKRNLKWLPAVALWMLLMRCVDLFWMIRPDFPNTTAIPTIWDFAALLALGGLWVWFFALQLKQRPLLPLGEPKLAEAIAHDEH